MAMISQQTFVERLNDAETEVVDLALYVERLAARLVGYADDAKAVDGAMPTSGILNEVGSTATRILRASADIRSHLRRIEESLPAEPEVSSVSDYHKSTAGLSSLTR